MEDKPLFNDIPDEKEEQAKQHLEEAKEFLRQFSPVIGKTPWSNYVYRVNEEGYPFFRANHSENKVYISYKICPIPVHLIPEKARGSYDALALEDLKKASIMPMLATPLYVFTPHLLMLMSARPSTDILGEIRNNCLSVAKLWKTSTDEEERKHLLQNLIELEDVYKNTELQIKSIAPRDWPEKMLATEVMAQYMRVINMIRSTHGFSVGDPVYASQMTKLIRESDEKMEAETKKLNLNTTLYEVLNPISKQIARTGSVYDLGDVNVQEFHEQLIGYTFNMIHIMERLIMRVGAPNIPEDFYFYHCSSPQCPPQNNLTRDELVAIRTQQESATRYRSTFDPHTWPEYKRGTSIINTLAASVNWPSEPLLLCTMDRIQTATAMVACARVIAKAEMSGQLKKLVLSAFRILCHDDYSYNGTWNDGQWVALLTNHKCTTGMELPIELVGSSYIDGI